MNKINNPILEEMFNNNYKEFEYYIYKNNKELKEKSEITLECLAKTFEYMTKNISDTEVIEIIKREISKVINNYTEEFKLVISLFYKYGVINGVENYEKLK